MRFLFFAAQYPPTVGGVERYTHGLAKTVVSCGHEAAVATSALPGLPAHETEDGVEIFRLPARLWMRGRFPVVRKNAEFRRMTDALFKKAADLAVINTRFYPLSLFAARECKKRNIPAIVVEHGAGHLSADGAVMNLFVHLFEHFAMRRIRKDCNRFYGVSRAACEWLRHFGTEAEGTLYNAVDPDAIREILQNAGFSPRAAFGIPDSAPMIVFSGRFIREKGIFELLEGFGIVRDVFPGASLVMAGGGPLLKQVKEMNPPGVIFPGALPYPHNLALIRGADVFVLPTYSEGFSTAVLEAAALGAMVITTRTGGSPELIVQGESGVLLNEISASAIAEALKKTLPDRAFCRRAGEKARQNLEARFTFSKTAERLVEIGTAKIAEK